MVEEVRTLREKQAEIEAGLKRDLGSEAFRSILEWEDVFNYRNTLEREWLYLAGVKDGVRLYEYLLDFMGSGEIQLRQ
ncbi:hypothetical protein QD46_07690 [Paenibacillus polymyxa]|uniref:hypothetical protein n=1 Tax=Paenibacillus polymyxa TaxID=1406 RepID=UPI0005CE3534|nr:hypothetical protein [Paenibacillus polymyxa]KJD40522.1 hypothetical protein QD46_07690 [Paenibacillus polymyxa]